MKKKQMLIIVGTLTNDGYQTRIEMEMELLSDFFDFHVFASDSSMGITLRTEASYYYYRTVKTKYKTLNGILNKIYYKIDLEKTIRNNHYDVVCFESMMPLLRASGRIKREKIKMIYDCHGTQPDEYLLYHRGPLAQLISKFYRFEERRKVRQSDLIVTVTDRQFDMWKVNNRHVKLPMIPASHFLSQNTTTCNDIRKELEIPDEAIVFVYSGQNSKWQMCNETVAYYKRIEERNRNAFLLILSPAIKEFHTICNQMGINRYKVVSVPYYDMPRYLDNCNFGFCLRENHIINLVASPTKVLEYLSRNVRPILSSYVGEYSGFLQKNDMASVVELSDEFSDYDKKVPNGNRFVNAYVRDIKQQYLSCILDLVACNK